jgi:hypothetical protein
MYRVAGAKKAAVKTAAKGKSGNQIRQLYKSAVRSFSGYSFGKSSLQEIQNQRITLGNPSGFLPVLFLLLGFGLFAHLFLASLIRFGVCLLGKFG